MRTGADYRASLRDGRRVWVMNEGRVEDVATHPATAAMVGEYAAWYDRHFDPAWRGTLLTPGRRPGRRRPGLGRPAAHRRRPAASGGQLFGHHLPQRRQRHPHPRLRPPHRPRRRDHDPRLRQIPGSGGQRGGVPALDRGNGAVPDLLLRRRDDRRPAESRSRQAQRPGRRPAHARGPGDRRQGRDAHQPGLRRGHLRRRQFAVRARGAPRHLRRPRQRARRDDPVPEGFGARRQPVPVATVGPPRRIGRADVAGRRVRPQRPAVFPGRQRRSDRPLAVLAPTVLLAVQGRLRVGPWAWRWRTRWGWRSTARRSRCWWT